MKAHRKKKLSIVVFITTGLSVAVALALFALSSNIDLFFTPTQVAAGEVPHGQHIRVGGMVKEGSVQHSEEVLHVRFAATDYNNDVWIDFEGILPDLFREGQGIVAEGTLHEDGRFVASRVLARHDENYMSQEVKAALDAAERDRQMMSQQQGVY